MKKNIYVFISTIIGITGFLALLGYKLLNTYNYESLVCSHSSNECSVYRTNVFGIQKEERLIAFNNIKELKIITQKDIFKKKSYNDKTLNLYKLVIIDKNNNIHDIFKTKYTSSNQVKIAQNNLTNLIKDTSRNQFDYVKTKD